VVALLACAGLRCGSAPTARAVPEPVASAEPPVERADGCRRDIPDCSAACALRETKHLEFIDWYDRRCAAVILGKNPDTAAGTEPAPRREAPERSDDCNPPYSFNAEGIKIWKRECL